MKAPLVSVIVATFNSARLLPDVLSAIRAQTYPQESIEILLVDGGSKDDTPAIGKKFRCRIVDNPNVEPVSAKHLGYMEAKGNFIIYIDHDEIMTNLKSIEERVRMFQQNPQVKAATGDGYIAPKGYGIINRYINEFGDPFSFFMYRLSKSSDFFVSTMRQRYPVIRTTKQYEIFDVSASSHAALIELVAGGGMIDAAFFKKNFPQIVTQPHLIPHLLYLLQKDFPQLAVMKGDALIHYAADDIKGYLEKIMWRVKNNIFHTATLGVSGYAGRAEYQRPFFNIKKILFIPYAFSFVLPCMDATCLMVTRRDLAYSIHLPLTLLTLGLILYYSVLKVLNIKPELTSYDGTTKAYEKK